MSDTLRHWTALSKTDPKHTKPFTRAGGFKGTATKPIWIEYRLTEHFGPCGTGWGCDEPVFTLVPASEEILVFCTLRCWYMEGDDGKQRSLYGVGGDKILAKNKYGLATDDEAYKKAFTDAIGNAFKHLGSNADVHMGLFEDSKYLAEVKREFAEQPGAAVPGPNLAAIPPSPEETPEAVMARQHIKALIIKYTGIIKTAPHRIALELAFDDGREELNEIEAAGENGKNAARELRDRYMRRLAEFSEGKAA